MHHVRLRALAALVLTMATTLSLAATPDVPQLQKMSARLAPVDIRVDLSALPENERAALAHIIQAAQILDALFLKQVSARNDSRLMLLVKHFSHNLFIHQTLQAAKNVYDPFAVADDARLVHRFHHADTRGVASVGDVAAIQLLLKRFEEIWQASAQAVTATTIGL